LLHETVVLSKCLKKTDLSYEILVLSVHKSLSVSNNYFKKGQKVFPFTLTINIRLYLLFFIVLGGCTVTRNWLVLKVYNQ
jgi:hypothetical protein